MLIKLRVNQLNVNLPLEDSQIFILINTSDDIISLPQSLNCPPSDQCVLIPEVAQVAIPLTEFDIQIDNLSTQRGYNLYVLAVSNSNSKIVFLGSVAIDVPQFYNSSFQNHTISQYQKSLQQVQNQKGFIIYQLQSILSMQPVQTGYNHFIHKSSESLDNEETSSSDSYDANLKQLNQTIDSQPNTNSPNPKTQFSFYNQRNADFSQKIIVEEIDLEDSQDDVLTQKHIDSYFMSRQSINHNKCQQYKRNIFVKQNFHKQKSNNKENIKQRLRQQKLNIQRYFHHLQQSDHFLYTLQQKLRYFKQ